MLCKSCNKSHPKDDFLLGSKDCYRCVYQRKVNALYPPKKVKEARFCEICDKKIPKDKRKYCSPECAYVQKMKQDKERWYRSISVAGEKFN